MFIVWKIRWRNIIFSLLSLWLSFSLMGVFFLCFSCRFSYEGRWKQKLQTFVDFSLDTLDLAQYVIGPKQNLKRYCLYGVSVSRSETCFFFKKCIIWKWDADNIHTERYSYYYCCYIVISSSSFTKLLVLWLVESMNSSAQADFLLKKEFVAKRIFLQACLDENKFGDVCYIHKLQLFIINNVIQRLSSCLDKPCFFHYQNHYGGLDGGHYTAYCKNVLKQRWYKFDDHEVSDISTSSVKSSAAYILFYSTLWLSCMTRREKHTLHPGQWCSRREVV